ncbi:MAG TPA: response regulator [Candidatus Fermentibacter daniensis]|nr:response regulator [Candidatus Fermentibacter daniensis]
MPNRTTILWVDDEIDHLQSHIRFLEKLGYRVITAMNAMAGLEILRSERIDLVLMDQMMVGMDGLEAVSRIRADYLGLPIVMVTQSEEEELMDKALGGQADDYLTKPVNPSQIQLVIKRLLKSRELRTRQAAEIVSGETARILEMHSSDLTWDDWTAVYKAWAVRDVSLGGQLAEELNSVQRIRFEDLALDFSKFIERNFPDWIQGRNTPLMPHNLLERIVVPAMRSSRETVLIVMDCMRFDQWLVMSPALEQFFHIDTSFMCTCLPSATPYSRNSLFAGLLPRDIWRFYRSEWIEEYGVPGLNRNEHAFLRDALRRLGGIQDPGNVSYVKIASQREGELFRRSLSQHLEGGFLAIIINYLDHLTHGRSELDLLRDLAPDVSSFRKLASTWFESSYLRDLLRTLAARGATVIVTSDHGSVLCRRQTPVRGARGMSSSIRYRLGHALNADLKAAVIVREPALWGLPDDSPSKTYVFARSDYLLIHPGMPREDIYKFEDTFQHGGISMEEMIAPCAVLSPKKGP